MESTGYEGGTERQDGYLGLLGLILGLAAGGALLYTVAGPPHLPAGLPSLEAILFTLRGSYLPPEVLAHVLTTAAWAVWVWIVVSVLLRLLVVGAETLTHGATWVRSFRVISDLVTLPVVRRLVDGALVALIVVNLLGRTPPDALAATLTPTTTVSAAAPLGDVAPPAQPWGSRGAKATSTTQYAVRSGDTLWSIAKRFYGTGHEYPRLVAANAGRQMLDGRRFTQAAVIHPGWVLLVPPARGAVEETNGRTYYVVEQGDTLRGIAARRLGDEARWPEIFEINRDFARLADGRVLKEPGLIWPGLRLELPSATGEPGEERLAPRPDPGAVEEAPSAAAPGLRIERPAPVPALPGEKTAPATAEPPAALEPARQPDPVPGPAGSPVSALAYGAAGLAGAAIAGGAALLARRRVRRSLNEPPVRAIGEGSIASSPFAEAEPARVLAHRIHGDEVEPVVLVADRLLRFLASQRLADVSLISASQSRSAVELTLSVPLAAQSQILDLAREFATLLGCAGHANLTPGGDIALRVTGLKRAGLMAQLFSRTDETPCLLPVGVLPDNQTLYASWRELGHILVVGVPGGGADVVVTSLISALAARRRPDELRVWAIASRRILPDQLGRLPHLAAAIVDPGDGDGVIRALGQVRTELLTRMRRAERDDAPGAGSERDDSEIVLVVGELAEIDDKDGSLELIALHGEECGIRLLAATADPACLEDAALARFRTRLVLQTADEVESIRLLGRPDAADLGDGGVLLRIDGRTPVQVRGFRVAAESLEQLVRVMREAYPHQNADSGAMVKEPVIADPHLTEATATAIKEEGSGASGPGTSARDPGESEDQPNEYGNSAATGAFQYSEDAGPPLDADTLQGRKQAGGDEDESAPVEAEAAHASPEPVRQIASPPALLQIRCFGGFVVTSGDREISATSDEGASFKAWEILAFLASQPEGATPKEKLLEAIWPEVEPERAANRMRVAMVRLRALLSGQVPGFPSEAVRCERDGTCHFDTSLVFSDVHRFVSLCRSASKLLPAQARAALVQARALYGGDLLSSHGTVSYGWVDERSESGLSLRESYREEYYRATQHLARLHCQEGEPQRAVPLYRALLKAEPTLEDVVRDLYRCYGQLGDLSPLIREDRHLRQALREAYYDPDDPEDDPACYEPEPETTELFSRIRRELEAKSARASVVSQ